MGKNNINIFNKNLQSLLKNIIENFSDLKGIIENNYTFPLEGEGYLNKFIINNKNKGNDISNKNEIIFSKGLIILEYIDFNYIWNHGDMSHQNKNIIWKYIQSLYLYSLEYSENINLSETLKQFNETNEIKDDISRNIIKIFNNLSNKIESDELSSDVSEEKPSSFKMPDLSSFLGKHLMALVNNMIDKIDLHSIELDNPLQLVQLLLSGSFSLKNDTSGIGLMVKNLIDNLKLELLSPDTDRVALFKDIENVLLLINNFTNNNYDIRKVIPNFNDKEFNNNFDTIINSIDFESILNSLVSKIADIKEHSNIDINQLLEQIIKEYSNNKNMDINNLINIAMKIVSGMQNSNQSTNNDSEQSFKGIANGLKGLESLDLNNIISNVMGDLNGNNTSTPDLNNIIKSVTNNLPSELSKNIPKDLDISSMTNELSNLLNGNNLDELKKMMPSAKNTRINTSKLHQLSRLEKRRDKLRKKLEQRKRNLNLK